MSAEEIGLRIAELVASDRYQPIKPGSLAKRLGLTKDQLPEFRAALENRLEERTLVLDRRGRVRPRSVAGTVVGKLRRSKSGCYVRLEGNADARELDVFVAFDDAGRRRRRRHRTGASP
ncbi:MAG: hypothetical protein AAF532_02050 [Planctomycetota bacterium]